MKKRFFASLLLFATGVTLLNRQLFKANHGFSLHVIEAPVPAFQDPHLDFPREVFSQPFHYLGKGAQSFVFESADKKTVLKFYRFPSHLRRFPWTHHPLGYLFSSSRKEIKDYNLKRLALSFHSFYLAAEPLSRETGVQYVHLQPTTDLHQKVHLIDKLGFHYQIPLDPIVFVIQKRGISFLSQFKKELAEGHREQCKHMLNSLINLIQKRCSYKISDLDNMDHENYGWLENEALHLDIGRFQEKELINVREEILRVAHPLTTYLVSHAPDLHHYFNDCLLSLHPE